MIWPVCAESAVKPQPTNQPIFTDGSKTTNRTAAATFFQNSNICISHRLPTMFSIYSAELYSIKLALLHIPETHYHSHILFLILCLVCRL